MKMHEDVEEILISHEEIVSKCAELGKLITKDYEGKNPLFIGLLKGSVPFMAELVKHVECPMEMDFMDVSSYNGVSSTGNVRIIKDITVDVTNRHVILVEDIIDTGTTLHEVVKLYKTRNVASLEIVSLLDKKEGRKIDVSVKYVGFAIKNRFVIGFGLDYNEQYRNLAYVGVLRKSVYTKED